MDEESNEFKDSIKISNRRAFRRLVSVIAGWLEQDYSRTEIWQYFTRIGKLNMSYSQFCRYIKRYIGKRSGLELQRQKMLDSPAAPKPGTSSSPAAEGGSRARKRDPPGVFNHNPKAKSLSEFAYGKTEVKKDGD